MTNSRYIKSFQTIGIQDIDLIGGKNASLGEMYNALRFSGVRVPEGFATTSEAYWDFLEHNQIRDKLTSLMASIDIVSFKNLKKIGNEARSLILNSVLPEQLASELTTAYHALSDQKDRYPVPVRSSATAEDLPSASFAGQHDSFLNISGEETLRSTCIKCYASLFNDRAIKYRINNGFKHMQVALSIGVQQMVRSDLACAGVAFTLEPESGFRDMIYITGGWGLGENIVQGAINPDEFYLFKPSIRSGKHSIISRKMGEKSQMMVYASSDKKSDRPVENINTPPEKMHQFVLSDGEIELLGKWCLLIEEHYGKPMDIEWAKDGISDKLFIVQARPETIHSMKSATDKKIQFSEFKIIDKGRIIVTGRAVGHEIRSGKARVLKSPQEAHLLKEGEILVTDITNPDWNVTLRKASVIVTNKGGRTSHAAIVARELGVMAVVGTIDATEKIKTGDVITVSCAEGHIGKIYEGSLQWQELTRDIDQLKSPATSPYLILADPDKALQYNQYPSEGVGLMRLEFVINNSIKIHPLALLNYDSLEDVDVRSQISKMTHNYPNKSWYFVEQLSEAIAFVAASFYPRPVIVRMSDFKTNEYANLIGGKSFEPEEENPMLGFRGASRYYSDLYSEGFRLECEAIKVVRNQMGLTNLKVMIPFCRTVEEGKKVIDIMRSYGLSQGENGLEIYVMIEIPSNVILANQFAQIFDGFSIGTNDLTQLTLGIDRDSAIISDLFDEKNEAVKWMLSRVIRAARDNQIEIGLCGQAPSDYPEFAQFLVSEGINSISYNPDALFKGIENILLAESTSMASKN